MHGTRFWLRWSLRDLRLRVGLVISLALVISVATGVSASLGSMEQWRLESNDKSYAVLNMHDLRVSLAADSTVAQGELAAAAASITDPQRIAATQERLLVPTQLDASVGGKPLLVRGEIVGVPTSGPGAGIDARSVEQGRDLTPADDGQPVAVIEGNFGRLHAIPIPTTVRLAGVGDVKIVGRALQPEQFMVTRPGLSFGAEVSFAYLYAPLTSVQRLGGQGAVVNELVVDVAAGADPAAVQRDLAAAFARQLPETTATITPRSEEISDRLMYDDAESDQQMMDIFSWILLIGAAFAAFNLVSRVVEAQRREIGVGLALGVEPRWLAIRPILFALEVAVIGVLLGTLVALGTATYFAGLMRDILPLPVQETPFAPETYLRAALLGLIVPVLAAIIPVLRAVRVTPIEAIRIGAHTATRTGLAPLLERLPLPGSVLAKMPLRNVARAPRRSLLSLLAIGAAITVMITMTSMLDSFTVSLADSRSEALAGSPQRMVATLDAPVPAAGPTVQAIGDAETVTAASPGLLLPVELGTGGERFEVSLQLIEPGNPAWEPRLASGTLAGSGIVISQLAADDLGVRIGDTVSVRHPRRTGPTTFETVETPFVVTGLHANPLRPYAYMDMENAAAFGLAGVANVVEVRPTTDATQDEVTRELLQQDAVVAVESGAAIPDAAKRYMEYFLSVVWFVEIITAALVALIAFNTLSIAREERRRESATLFAFGMPVWRVTLADVTESAIIGVLGTLAGLAIGLALASWITYFVARETFPDLGMEVTLSPASLAVAVLLGVGAVALAPVLGARRYIKSDISSTLRVVE